MLPAVLCSAVNTVMSDNPISLLQTSIKIRTLLAQMKKEYTCAVYEAKKAFIFLLVILIAYLFIIGYITIRLKLLGLFVVAFIAGLVGPLFFLQKIKSLFTYDAQLVFDTDGISITLSGNDGKERTYTYRWDNVKAYKFYFTPSKLTYLDIYPRTGNFKEFGFKDKKSEDLSIKEESVFSLFRSFVRQYNQDKAGDERIQLTPGFLTTPGGTGILVGTGLLIISAAVIHFTQGGRFTPLFFMAFIFFLPLFAKRSSDKSLYERMKDPV